jgi:hypothetical protein
MSYDRKELSEAFAPGVKTQAEADAVAKLIDRLAPVEPVGGTPDRDWWRMAGVDACLDRMILILERAEKAEADTERLDWLIDNCPYLPLKRGIHLRENSRAAIDEAAREHKDELKEGNRG